MNQIIIANGTLLFFLGAIPLIFFGYKENISKYIFAFLSVIFLLIIINKNSNKNYKYEKDGIYEKITVFDGTFNNRPTRFLMLDRSLSSAIYLDSKKSEELVFEYSKYFSVYKIFNPNIKKALIVGGGAYSIPKALLSELPDVEVTVSEIEPTLYEISKKYFNLSDNIRLINSQVDGRSLLANSKTKYDLIFCDVYQSLYSIPSHFTTQEFFNLAKNRLNKEGILIVNLIGNLSDEVGALTLSEIKTIQNVFPNNYLFATRSPKSIQTQNLIIVGFNSDKKTEINIPEKKNLFTINSDRLKNYPILTDDYSPIEYLSGKMLANLR